MKAKSSKELWEAERARYTWHLRPPFKNEFDRTHWWKTNQAKFTPLGALFELVRRHPRVGDLIALSESSEAARRKLEPDARIRIVSQLAFKSWPQISTDHRELLKDELTLKGVDYRTDRIVNISTTIGSQMSFKPTTGWRSKIRVLDVGDHALEFSSKGYLIIGIFPDLKAEDATTLFKTLYLSHQKQNKIKAQRFRYGKGTWFALIEAFENTVLSANHAEKDFSNHYIPYKKLMDGITVQLTPWNNCRHD